MCRVHSRKGFTRHSNRAAEDRNPVLSSYFRAAALQTVSPAERARFLKLCASKQGGTLVLWIWCAA